LLFAALYEGTLQPTPDDLQGTAMGVVRWGWYGVCRVDRLGWKVFAFVLWVALHFVLSFELYL